MENGLMEEKDREGRKGTEADERGEETAIMVDDGQDSHERICPYGEIVSYKSFIDRKRAFRSILISLFLFLYLYQSIFLFIISSDRNIIPHERSPPTNGDFRRFRFDRYNWNAFSFCYSTWKLSSSSFSSSFKENSLIRYAYKTRDKLRKKRIER